MTQIVKHNRTKYGLFRARIQLISTNLISCFSLVLALLILLTGCASSYRVSNPENMNFVSFTSSIEGLKLYYKYDLLDTKYAKKEERNGVKVIAIKIINTSGQDYVFGEDVFLRYKSGGQVHILNKDNTYKSLKQGSAIYALYLLMTPINLYRSETNSNNISEETSSIPIGWALGPGLSLGNILVSSSANKKFKNQLNAYNPVGKRIKDGETFYGIVPIKSKSFDALQLELRPN